MTLARTSSFSPVSYHFHHNQEIKPLYFSNIFHQLLDQEYLISTKNMTIPELKNLVTTIQNNKHLKN